MIEKLKQLGAASKEVVLYILTPVLLVIGYIVYLQSKLRTTKGDLAIAKSEQELAKSLDKTKELENDATKAEADYKRTRDEYLRNLE